MEAPKAEERSLPRRIEPQLKGFDNSYRSLQLQHRNVAARLQPLQYTTPVSNRSVNVEQNSPQLSMPSIVLSPTKQMVLPPLDDKAVPKAPGAPISENDKSYQPRYPMWN